MKKIGLIAVLFVVTAISIGQNPPATASNDNENGIVFIYRYKQYLGSGLEPSVYMDEQELARMDNGRFFAVRAKPGKHVFRSNDQQSAIELNVAAGVHYFIRVELVVGFWKGHGRLVLVQPEQGMGEVKRLEVIGADKIKNKELVIATPPPPMVTAVAAAQVTPAAETTFEIHVESTPAGADIEANGIFVGSTPSAIKLTPGEHDLRVVKAGYKPWTRKMRVTAPVRIVAELEQESAEPKTPN